MVRRLLLLVLALLWFTPVGAAENVAETAPENSGVHVHEPRAFGHFVGDLVTRSIEVDLAPGEEIVPGSVPQPGQVLYWLELRSSEAKVSDAGRASVDLIYQLFYVPVDTRRLELPAVGLEVEGPTGRRTVRAPPLAILVSPIREIYPEKSGETTETFLKSDARAKRLATGRLKSAALAAALASLASAALLAFHRAWWPFHARPQRPFTAAAREIAQRARAGDEAYGEELIALHRAFDRALGARLLGDDVDAFLAERPEQRAERPAIENFFAASRAYFFSGDRDQALKTLSTRGLFNLAQALAVNERALR